MSSHNVPRKPTLLIILDGFGCNPNPAHNAVAIANTPNLDYYFSNYPFTKLQASGAAVGLPEGQMGNSEVGHLTIGSGNIYLQDLVRIDDAIKTGSFYRNHTLLDAMHEARRTERPLHLIGLVSDGGVHSHINHLIALIDMCKEEKVKPALHMITDGRDTAPKSALAYLDKLEPVLNRAGGHIASISGRYFAMDRDKRWDRVEKAWRCMCFGEAKKGNSAKEAIQSSYSLNQTDEFIEPVFIAGGAKIEGGDQAIFFNFRNDRARQLSYVLAGKDFKPFDRGDFRPVSLSCLTEYDTRLPLPIAFPPEYAEKTLAEIISQNNIRQLHCAETEKYAHVTFFFNGGREKPFPGEDRQMIQSPNVATYDLAPEMAAADLADEVIDALKNARYGFIVVNFANGDMVGHTAVEAAIVKAVECLDEQAGKLLRAAEQYGYSVILTADHGNCDEMVDPVTGEPHTQHTTHPVPCLILDDEKWELKQDAGLSNIAPTILKLMGLPQPEKMKAIPIISKVH